MKLKNRLRIDYYLGGLLHPCLKPVVSVLGALLRREHRLDTVREVTFLKLLGGGSLVIAYPMLLAFKKSGRFRLRLVGTAATIRYAEPLGIFDECVAVDDRSLPKLLATSLAALRRLFRGEAIVDLEIHSRLSVIFTLLTCTVNRIGFYSESSFWRRGLNTHLLFLNRSAGIFHFYDQIAALFGLEVPHLGASRPAFRANLGLPPERPARPETEPFPPFRIGVGAACSDLAVERMLYPEQWTAVLGEAVAQAPAGRSVEIVLFGGPGDRALCEKISGTVGPTLRREVAWRNEAGKKSLAESVLLLDTLDRFVCIDSGLLHFARLLGVPSESYWGPTSPATLLRDFDPALDTVRYAPLPCSPCVHITNTPPCLGNNLCIKRLTDPALRAVDNPGWLLPSESVAAAHGSTP